MQVRSLAFAAALLLIPACTSGPNHIGNPLTLPGRAITNGISEAAYKARRGRVERFVRGNLTAIHADIASGSGPAITEVMEVARVPPENMQPLIAELCSNPTLYTQPDIEPLIVAIMVHSH